MAEAHRITPIQSASSMGIKSEDISLDSKSISGEEAYLRRMAMLNDIPSVPELHEDKQTSTLTL